MVKRKRATLGNDPLRDSRKKYFMPWKPKQRRLCWKSGF